MKRWRCDCGEWGRLPPHVDALVEGYRRLIEHEKTHADKEEK